jgi:hypothetical protein
MAPVYRPLKFAVNGEVPDGLTGLATLSHADDVIASASATPNATRNVIEPPSRDLVLSTHFVAECVALNVPGVPGVKLCD